ncbi:MAG: hypothetical protein QM635_05620, partial [Microbacteriaceae bacterium]
MRLHTTVAVSALVLALTASTISILPASAATRTTVETTTLVTAKPTISGTLAVGKTITAKPGSWTTGTKFKYRWYRGSEAIIGATKSTYKLTTVDTGKTIKVAVTGSLAGHGKKSRTSAATARIATRAVSATTPTISGSRKVGATLTAKPGDWTTGSTLKYQWYRGSSRISGATKSTYKIVMADENHTIFVKVTGKKSGYAEVSKSSSATGIIPPPSSLGTGETVQAGQSLRSPNGKYTLKMQSDGNLVLYNTSSIALWASATNGSAADHVTMQRDGNLVLYTASGSAKWASNTAGNSGSNTLQLRNDGTIVVRHGDDATWAAPYKLAAGRTLAAGQALFAPNGKYRLTMQSDGNLVVRTAAGTAKWATNTAGSSANHVTMQSDGNLVVRTAAGTAKWATNTA